MQKTQRTTTRRISNPTEGGASLPSAEDALERAVGHLASLQREDGAWEGEMVWNTMLLSQYVLVGHATGQLRLTSRERTQIIKHFTVTQLPDGSWPIHIESGGYLFFTTLAYVALRVLGVEAEDPRVARARVWIHARDVRAIPTWGKFWLSVLGLYEYAGMNPVPPELFLLPKGGVFHPDDIYCHTRYAYVAMAYLYGRRFVADLGSLRDELRTELYPDGYDEADFVRHRHDIHAGDVYVHPGRALATAFDAWNALEPFIPGRVRARALRSCLERVEYEQRASRFRGLSPVNGLLNVLVLFAADPQHRLLAPSMRAMRTWQWEDEAEGIRLCGARSTAWDTAFALRALAEAWPSRGRVSKEALTRGYRWLVDTQIKEDLGGREPEARDSVLGGFCFSAGDERWPVSDCTAEALTSMLAIHCSDMAPPTHLRMRDEDARNAVEFILQRQNRDGGFGTYENRRSRLNLSALNPSEMYGDCMSERTFTECTASCVDALVAFLDSSVMAPTQLRERARSAVNRAVGAISRRQREDGSFAGSWGINFTFGTFHAIEALSLAGVPTSDPRITRAVDWLVSRQKQDGGWGEHWHSCATEQYVEHEETQATMTAWALLGLLRVLPATHPAIERGISALRALQQKDGSWPRQAPAGVFFVTCVLDYVYYKDYFPAWALARYVESRADPHA